jgi:hypothetical protein
MSDSLAKMHDTVYCTFRGPVSCGRFWHSAAVPNRRLALTAIITCGVAAILASAGVAVWVTVTYDPPPGANRPNLADWLQAWGSWAAVVAGLLAVVGTVLLLAHEMGEARRGRVQAAGSVSKPPLTGSASTKNAAKLRWRTPAPSWSVGSVTRSGRTV